MTLVGATIGGSESTNVDVVGNLNVVDLKDTSNSSSSGYNVGYTYTHSGAKDKKDNNQQDGIIGSLKNASSKLSDMASHPLSGWEVSANKNNKAEATVVHGAIASNGNINAGSVSINNEASSSEAIFSNVHNNKELLYRDEDGYNFKVSPKEFFNNAASAIDTVKVGVEVGQKVGKQSVKIYKISEKYTKEQANILVDYFFVEAREKAIDETRKFMFTKEDIIKQDMYEYASLLQINGHQLETYESKELETFSEDIKDKSKLNDYQYDKYMNREVIAKETQLELNVNEVNSVIDEYNQQLVVYENKLIEDQIKLEVIPNYLSKLANEEIVIWDNYRGQDSGGDGSFGSGRKREDGRDQHYGQDILSTEGYLVLSPVSGKVEKINTKYDSGKQGDKAYLQKVQINYDVNLELGTTKIEKPNILYGKKSIDSITGKENWKYTAIEPTFTMFYVSSSNIKLHAGDKVNVGQIIGEAQSLTAGYGSNVPDHVHVQAGLGSVFPKTKQDTVNPREIWDFEKARIETINIYKPLINSATEVKELSEKIKTKE